MYIFWNLGTVYFIRQSCSYLIRYLHNRLLGGKALRQAAIRFHPFSMAPRFWLFQHWLAIWLYISSLKPSFCRPFITIQRSSAKVETLHPITVWFHLGMSRVIRFKNWEGNYHLNNIINHGLFLAISEISIIHESQDLYKIAKCHHQPK